MGRQDVLSLQRRQDEQIENAKDVHGVLERQDKMLARMCDLQSLARQDQILSHMCTLGVETHDRTFADLLAQADAGTLHMPVDDKTSKTKEFPLEVTACNVGRTAN